MYYKIMGKKIFLKPGVVPHKYMESPPPTELSSSLSDSARKRKLDTLMDYCHQPMDHPLPSTSKGVVVKNLFHEESPELKKPRIQSEVPSPSGVFLVHQSYERITRSVGVQVNLRSKVKVRSASTNTKKVSFKAENMVDEASSPLFREKHVKSNVYSSPSSTISVSSKSTVDYTPSSSDTTSEDERDIKQNRLISTVSILEKYPKFFIGIPKNTYDIIKMISEECKVPKKHVLITLKKIRLNDSYFRLALDFGLSVSRIQQIFVQMVPKIASLLQNLIFFPKAQTVMKLLPIPFRARYAKVQCIIDCFEIEIEKPSDPVAQASTWSEYKHCNTVKFLISSTPNGFINFISECFAGRISDKDIVLQSNFLDRLPSECHVMADRGFKHISTLLEQKKCKLIRPPSVSSNQKSSKSEVNESKQIASLRIHIERVIRRIREFEISKPHAVVNNNLIKYIHPMMIIVCALINLEKPLLE